MIQKIKKPVSILLSLFMVFSLFTIVPITASAYDGNPYSSLVNTTTSVKFNDIDWYIIADNSTAADAGTVMLLTKEPIAAMAYLDGGPTAAWNNNQPEYYHYSTSTVKAYLDGLTDEGGSFADVADAIASTDLTDDGVVSGVKLFLPRNELSGVPSNVLKCTNINGVDMQNRWWRRGKGNWNTTAAAVSSDEGVASKDVCVGLKIAVRPVLNLDLSKVTFDSATNTFAPSGFTVTWKNYDGTILETDENVEYGTTPEYNGATPTKTATAQYTYTFSGWDKDITAVTGDVTYTAQFTETTNSYTVTWKNDDGTILETDENVEYGTTPTYDSATPTKADYAEYRYIFNSWTDGTNEYAVDDTLPAVTGDVVYTATFITASRFEETVDAKSPTCVEDGNIAYFVGHDGKYYTLADGEYTEISAQDVVLPATGIHTAGEPVKENEVAPTYESEGSYEEVVYCSVCGEELSRQTVVVPMRKLIDVTELYMNNGGMYSAVLDIPEGDTYKIKSNDISVASVNSAGRIVARGEGTTEIEITTSSGMHVVCTVTVEVTDVNNITLDKSELVMNVKDSYTFTATYSDTETCSWKSSNPNVVTVNQNGRIVARGEGTATIYARAEKSGMATCEITVNKAPEEIILDKTELSLNSATKEAYTLKVALSPEDAQTTLTFKSSNPSVASVNSAGRIVARGEGTATIKVISTNGKVATCTVQVS